MAGHCRTECYQRQVAPPHSMTSFANWVSGLPGGHLTRPP
jgi:hypothetical protein